MSTARELTYAQAINEALALCLKNDPDVFVIGEGVPDPKGIFGSTAGLQKQFGPQRVMDMPVSENGLTGICIGAALRGMRPVMTHQRADFVYLCLDQIINNAAKWYFMFGGQLKVPLVVRMIIGRGWGQGAQHSQSLQALFAHVPGLKVIMPTIAYDAKGMLIAAIRDNNPVICLEHRWLYNLKDHVPDGLYKVPLGQARIVREGTDLTLVCLSYMTVEALKVTELLAREGIHIELIDLRTIKPYDKKLIAQSVMKTGRLLVADLGWPVAGMAAEIIAQVSEGNFKSLKEPPRRITLADIPTPSSCDLTRDFYPDAAVLARAVFDMLHRDLAPMEKILKELHDDKPHDVPDLSFKGPF